MQWQLPEADPGTFGAWTERYLAFVVRGIRSAAVTDKITLHLERFRLHFLDAYGHEGMSACLRRDVLAWQRALRSRGLAPATVNNHLASLSAFTTWVHARAPRLFACGDPCKGVGELGLPPLEPRALTEEQVRSLKSLCDRLPRIHQCKGRRHAARDEVPPQRQRGRPLRDRAIVFVLLSTGLRREELVRLDIDQLRPSTPRELRVAKRARIHRVRGKGKTERSVFLSADARSALCDYMEQERVRDVAPTTQALFLSATGIPARAADGRLSRRAVNLILAQLGRWHDAEVRDPSRRISPLTPHRVRHTFGFMLARSTGADAFELQRRLGHRSRRYIERYTNPPEHIAAGYVEEF